jgi:fumarate hydratase subunit beta
MAISITTPILDGSIQKLHIGDAVLINGTIVTARDSAHKWIFDRFITQKIKPTPDDIHIHDQLRGHLEGGVIYHCGPVVSGLDSGQYQFISAGPTTSMREEPYQSEIMRHFNLKGVIGKGGMGEKTLQECGRTPAVYLHAIGGAAALLAQFVQRVLGVLKLDFGAPEAMWIIDVVNFPAVVTMDAHQQSLHKNIREKSHGQLDRLIK